MIHLKLLFILLLTSGTLSFASNTCINFFSPLSPLATLEQVNKDQNRFISLDAPIEYHIVMLKKGQQKQVHKLLRRVEVGDISSEKDLLKVSEKFVDILFGRRDILNRYWRKSAPEREIESVRLQIKTQLVYQGLQSFLENQPTDQKLGLWIQTKKTVRKVFQSRAWNWLQVPFNLPAIKNAPIAEDLLFRIVWDGLEAHQEAIHKYFQSQGKRELYTTLSRIYSFVFIGILSSYSVYHGYQLETQKAETESRIKAEIITTQLDSFSEGLATQIQEHRIQLREEALQKSIQELQEALGRPPTEAEIQEMKDILFN